MSGDGNRYKALFHRKIVATLTRWARDPKGRRAKVIDHLELDDGSRVFFDVQKLDDGYGVRARILPKLPKEPTP